MKIYVQGERKLKEDNNKQIISTEHTQTTRSNHRIAKTRQKEYEMIRKRITRKNTDKNNRHKKRKIKNGIIQWTTKQKDTTSYTQINTDGDIHTATHRHRLRHRQTKRRNRKAINAANRHT